MIFSINILGILLFLMSIKFEAKLKLYKLYYALYIYKYFLLLLNIFSMLDSIFLIAINIRKIIFACHFKCILDIQKYCLNLFNIILRI